MDWSSKISHVTSENGVKREARVENGGEYYGEQRNGPKFKGKRSISTQNTIKVELAVMKNRSSQPENLSAKPGKRQKGGRGATRRCFLSPGI